MMFSSEARIRYLLVLELAIWLCLIYPTVAHWSNSVPYLVFVSLYAIIRTSLADIRIWHNERKDEEQLVHQTDRIQHIEDSLERIEKMLEENK